MQDKASLHSSIPNLQRRMNSLSGESSSLKGEQGLLHASIESWLAQKLKNEWSSYEIGTLLTKEKVAEALPIFKNLETPIKVGKRKARRTIQHFF